MALIRNTDTLSRPAYTPSFTAPAATPLLTAPSSSYPSITDSLSSPDTGWDASLSRSTWQNAGQSTFSSPSTISGLPSAPLSGAALQSQMARLSSEQLASEPPLVSISDLGGDFGPSSFTSPSMFLTKDMEAALKMPEATPEERARTAQAILDNHTSWGNLDEEAVGQNMAGNRRNPKLVGEILNKVSDSDRDDLSVAFARNLTDEQIAEMGKDPESKKLLQRVVGDLNSGYVLQDETTQVQRLTRGISAKHGRLVSDDLPPDVAKAVTDAGFKHQKISAGAGRVNFDEFSVTIDKMPPGVTPEQYLEKMVSDPNSGGGDKFKYWVEFQRQGDTSRPAKPGDIYDLNILGPEDAHVVLRDKEPNRFTFATIQGGKHGEHPIYGNREFGFNKNEDGSTTFYTRAADRMDTENGHLGGRVLSVPAQDYTWNGWLHGLEKQVSDGGGQVRPNSRTETKGLQP